MSPSICKLSRRVEHAAKRRVRGALAIYSAADQFTKNGGSMTKAFPAKSFLVFALLLICALQLVAQTDTGRIEGIVTDNTGGILPGATVTARNTGTNATRVDVTNSTGAYTLTALPVGNYRVQVDLSGFKTQVTPITLTVNQVARIDF